MATWTRAPEETSGTHRFNNRAFMTPGVRDLLGDELATLVEILYRYVQASDGLDYLQVFTSDEGARVWVIDDGTHHTWLLPSEY
jgi:hypothetical protein